MSAAEHGGAEAVTNARQVDLAAQRIAQQKANLIRGGKPVGLPTHEAAKDMAEAAGASEDAIARLVDRLPRQATNKMLAEGLRRQQTEMMKNIETYKRRAAWRSLGFLRRGPQAAQQRTPHRSRTRAACIGILPYTQAKSTPWPGSCTYVPVAGWHGGLSPRCVRRTRPPAQQPPLPSGAVLLGDQWLAVTWQWPYSSRSHPVSA